MKFLPSSPLRTFLLWLYLAPAFYFIGSVIWLKLPRINFRTLELSDLSEMPELFKLPKFFHKLTDEDCLRLRRGIDRDMIRTRMMIIETKDGTRGCRGFLSEPETELPPGWLLAQQPRTLLLEVEAELEDEEWLAGKIWLEGIELAKSEVLSTKALFLGGHPLDSSEPLWQETETWRKVPADAPLIVFKGSQIFFSNGTGSPRPVLEEELKTRVAGILRSEPATPFLIKFTKPDLPYSRVVRILGMLQQFLVREVHLLAPEAGYLADSEKNMGQRADVPRLGGLPLRLGVGDKPIWLDIDGRARMDFDALTVPEQPEEFDFDAAVLVKSDHTGRGDSLIATADELWQMGAMARRILLFDFASAAMTQQELDERWRAIGLPEVESKPAADSEAETQSDSDSSGDESVESGEIRCSRPPISPSFPDWTIHRRLLPKPTDSSGPSDRFSLRLRVEPGGRVAEAGVLEGAVSYRQLTLAEVVLLNVRQWQFAALATADAAPCHLDLELSFQPRQGEVEVLWVADGQRDSFNHQWTVPGP